MEKRLNPEHIKSVLKMINNGPFFLHMGMRVVDIGPKYSKVEISIDDSHMNPFGGVHGGVFSSAIDTAAYWSAYCDLPEGQGIITIDLKVDLLAPVSDRKIIVEGKRIKSGRTLFLTEAKMMDPNGRILAHGSSKLMVTDKQSIDDAVKYLSFNDLPKKFEGDF